MFKIQHKTKLLNIELTPAVAKDDVSEFSYITSSTCEWKMGGDIIYFSANVATITQKSSSLLSRYSYE